MRWDIHNHAVPESLARRLNAEFPVSVDGDVVDADRVRFKLTGEFTDPAAKLSRLEDVGLEAAIVSVVPALFCYHAEADKAPNLASIINGSLAQFCEQEPERLRWMAHVPLQAPASIADVCEEAKAAGAVGIQVGTSMAGKPLDHADFEPMWEAASRLGLPVMIHPAYNTPHSGLEDWYLQNAIGNLLETTIAAERLICSGRLEEHPSLRVVLVHAGGFLPWQIGRLRHVRAVRAEAQGIPGDPDLWMSRFMFDPITHDREVLAMLAERVGRDHLVMGTDAPFDMASPRPVDDLTAALGQEAAQEIMERLPVRLFDLDAAG